MRHHLAPRGRVAPMLAESSDGELLSRTVQGDKAAFEALIERHAPMVWGVCWHVLHHKQDAEDAFQQTFLVVMRKTASISKKESFRSWLRSVAYRTARDMRNGQRCHNKHEHASDTAQIAQIAQIDDELELREFLPFLDAEVQRLLVDYRLPLMLYYLEDKSEAETSAELGWTKGTVAYRLKKALEILRRNLMRHGIEPPEQPD